MRRYLYEITDFQILGACSFQFMVHPDDHGHRCNVIGRRKRRLGQACDELAAQYLGLDIHRCSGGGEFRTGDYRRINDHHRRGGFFHDPGRPVAGHVTVGATPAPQLPA